MHYQNVRSFLLCSVKGKFLSVLFAAVNTVMLTGHKSLHHQHVSLFVCVVVVCLGFVFAAGTLGLDLCVILALSARAVICALRNSKQNGTWLNLQSTFQLQHHLHTREADRISPLCCINKRNI